MTTADDPESVRPTHLSGEADLDAFVDNYDHALVEFYTEGCSICASMEPVLGNVARATDVAVALVNPRDDPPLVERFNVQSVPLLVAFVDGEPVGRRAEGFVGGEDLVEWLESVIA
ncbi:MULTISPECIES: thioredoxin family protein [Salinibaculum]|uniref:thioredoxin family protein n=1 Tax=Salinibaculum TaxID=2732368 RepID=UPI0030D50B0B